MKEIRLKHQKEIDGYMVKYRGIWEVRQTKEDAPKVPSGRAKNVALKWNLSKRWPAA